MNRPYSLFYRIAIALIILLALNQQSLAQNTIVNYDFNNAAAINYATLTPTLATNITSIATSTELYNTVGGVASGGLAFSANGTPGNAVNMTNSSGTNTRNWTFTLGGLNLPFYKTFKLYFQAQRSNTGATSINVTYSFNGAAFTNAGVSPVSIAPGNGTWVEAVITLPLGADNPTTLAFQLSASGASGTGTLRIDNFQVQAVMINTGVISGSPFCVSAGSVAVTVPYSSTAVYIAGNTFTAQLSDAAGSFAAPTTIGTLPGILNSGNISATIPAATAAGVGYRIRVVSSSPSATGTNNGTDLVIKKVVANAGTDQVICSGSSTTIGGLPSASGGTIPYGYAWTASPADPTLTNVANPIVTPAFSSINYTLTVTDNLGCASAPDIVNVSTSAGFTNKTWIGRGAGGAAAATNFNDPLNWSPAGVPGPCNNVVMNVNLNFSADAYITLAGDVTINNLSMTNTGFSAFSGASIFRIDVNTHSFTILGSTSISTVPTFTFFSSPPQTQISVAGGVVTYTGNLTTTVSGFLAYNLPFYATINNSGKFIVKGNATLGGIGNDAANKPAQVIFDGTGTQTITHNSGAQAIYFGATSTDIGQTNSPTVILSGGGTGGYRSIGNLNVNNTAILDVGTQTINRTAAGGSINLAAGSTMILANNTGGVAGSNFPSNYSGWNFNPTSTVEYNSGVVNQTIYAPPTYGNLTITGATTKTAGGSAPGGLTVAGNLLINSTAIFNSGVTGLIHNIGGNWTNNGTFTATPINTINFYGNNNSTISSTTIPATPTTFYRIRVDKGSSIATILDIGTGAAITINVTDSVNYQNGLVRVQPLVTFNESGTGPAIQANAGLEINGNFNLTNSTITNKGLLRIKTGSVSNFGTATGNSVDNNSNSIFDMSGGTVNIGARLTFSTGAFSTSTITGGTINLATVGHISGTGTLDMTAATKINISGGTIQLVKAKLAGAPPLSNDIQILSNPGTKSFTGGTIQIGTGSTPAVQIFKINSEATLFNFTVNSKGSPVARLATSPLKVGNNISILSAGAPTPDTATLDAGTNDKDISVGGGWTNNGKFIAGAYPAQNATVIFNGTGPSPQTISGTSKTTFNNLKDSNTVGITFNTSADITNAFSFGLINNSTVTIPASKFLTLKSSATNTARIADITNNNGNTGNKFTFAGAGVTQGQAVVERYYPAKRAWRLVTAPISQTVPAPTRTIWSQWQVGQVDVPASTGSGTYITMGGLPLGAGMDASENSSLKTWNVGTQTLDSVLNTKVILSRNLAFADTANNLGYFLFMRGDRRPSNLIPYTNSTITTLRDTGILQTNRRIFNPSGMGIGNFMLIGNPYASPVDFGALAKNNISDRFWSWDPYLNIILGGFALVFWNGSAYITTPNCMSCGASLQTSILQSTQAVFVQQNAATAASVSFNENNKSAINNLNVFRPVSSALEQQFFQANLLLPEPDTVILADGNYVQFDPGFSNSVDLDDAVKFSNILENFGILRDGKVLMLERRKPVSVADTIFFKLWNTTQRDYLFEFTSGGLDHTGLDAFLEDNYLHTSSPVNLNGNTIISFSITADAASKIANRFRVVFRPAGGPLPVTFTSLKAYRNNRTINVDWTVQNEINISQYHVERSFNGSSFINVSSAPAKANNYNTESYTWIDANAIEGTFYYRIQSISKNGEIRYSNIVKVTVDRGRPEIVIHPNPITGGTINLQFINQPKGIYDIRLFNKLGQVLMRKEVQHEEGSSNEILYPGKALSHGTYLLEVTSPDRTKINIKVFY